MTLNRGPDGIWSRNLEEEKLQREGCFASEFPSKPHMKSHNSNSVTLGNFPGESHLRVPLPLCPQNLGETERVSSKHRETEEMKGHGPGQTSK